MTTSFAPPTSFSARFRPCAGDAAAFGDSASRLLRTLLITATHVVAAAWLLVNTRAPSTRPDTTLSVDWLLEAPVAAKRPEIAPTPQRRTPVSEPAATPRPVAPSEPALPAPTERRSQNAPAATSEPRPAPPPILAPRFDADYLHNPAPIYPPLSRRLGEEGRLSLRVEVTTAGVARQIEVVRSSGSPRLDAAAIDAVRQWRFQPARQGDTPLAGWVQIPINFRLSNEP